MKLARDLDRGLNRFRAAGREMHVLQIAGSERRKPLRKFNRGTARVTQCIEELQLFVLTCYSASNLRPAMTDCGGFQRCDCIDVLMAALVFDIDTVSFDEHQRTSLVLHDGRSDSTHPKVVQGCWAIDIFRRDLVFASHRFSCLLARLGMVST